MCRCRANDIGTVGLGKLQRQVADPPGRTMDQYTLACFYLGLLDDTASGHACAGR